MKRPPDVEARVTYLPTSEGGKNCAVSSGYRPMHDFGVPDVISDAQHIYPDCQKVTPGSTARVLMNFLVPDIHKRRLYEGMEFTVREGNWVVGHGIVTRVLNEELKK